MKGVVSVLLLATLVYGLAACQKSKAERSVHDSMVGTWELRQASGMITTNYAAGNGNVLKFTDATYKRYTNGQLTESGTYKIVHDASVAANTCLVVADGQYQNRIDFSNAADPRKIFLQLSTNKLQFLSGCFAYDAGTSSTYERLEGSDEAKY